MITPSPALQLATRHDGSRDGQLMLLNRERTHWLAASAIAPTLQALLDAWAEKAPLLAALAAAADARHWAGAETFDAQQCMAPLPRAYQWADASVYRNHARLIYQWRQEPIPPRYEDEPLVYQGGSDVMLSGTQDIEARNVAHGIDLEAEIAVITTDVPMGVSPDQALQHIALVVLLNDVSLRNLIPAELSRGFGFYQSKPATSFAPIAVTPQALGDAWHHGMLHLPVHTAINGQWFGSPNAGVETVFHFGQVIAHLAQTRALCAGSLIGAGTISNQDPAAGNACITEARVRQMLQGTPEDQLHPYLQDGDRVRIEVLDASGQTVFGAIDQAVKIV
jgi:fumarylacetoacetate (FAA) hydrolase